MTVTGVNNGGGETAQFSSFQTCQCTVSSIALALGEAECSGLVRWKYGAEEPDYHVMARNKCWEGEDRNKMRFSKTHAQ